jgi:hypothetical protein
MDASSPVAIADAKTLSCGLIMPLAEFDNCSAGHWEEVRSIIGDAVERLSEPKFRTRMVSDGDETGIIHRRIIQNVYADPIAICDVSGRNPNVLFELGMRLAFDKPVVIIKDDKTPFMFDTGMIEHLPYPRDLRHGAIENFKAALAKKVTNTYSASLENPDSVSFIKSFGPFKTVTLEEVKEPADKAILSILGEMQGQINRLANSLAQDRRPLPPSLRRREPGGAVPARVLENMKNKIQSEMSGTKDVNVAELLEFARKEFGDVRSSLGEEEFFDLVKKCIVEAYNVKT